MATQRRSSLHPPGSPSRARTHGFKLRIGGEQQYPPPPPPPPEEVVEDEEWKKNEYEGVGIEGQDDDEAAAIFAAAKARSSEAVLDDDVISVVFSSTGIPSDEPVPQLLQRLLSSRWERVLTIFKAWDIDGNGSVDKEEFVKGLGVLGIAAEKDEIDRFFATFDPDATGLLDFRHLSSALRKHSQDAQEQIVQSINASNQSTLQRPNLISQALQKTNKMSGVLGQDLLSGVSLADGEIKGVVKTLKEAMRKNHARTIDLFTGWDADGNGEINRDEFAMALEMLGLDAPAEAISELFAEFDEDGSGSVSYAELTKQLRATSELAPALRDGAVKIDMRGSSKFAIRKAASRPKGMKLDVEIDLDDVSGGTVQHKLREALAKNWGKVKDLFVSWDTNGDGVVSRKEFHDAMRALGLGKLPPSAIDGIFCSFDLDGSGEVDFDEMHQILRQAPPKPTLLTRYKWQRTLQPPPPPSAEEKAMVRRKSLPAGVTLPLPGESDDEDVDMEEGGGDSPLGSPFGGSPMAPPRPMSLPPPSPATFGFAPLASPQHLRPPALQLSQSLPTLPPSHARPVGSLSPLSPLPPGSPSVLSERSASASPVTQARRRSQRIQEDARWFERDVLLRAAPAPAPAPDGFRPPSPPYSPPQRGSGAEGSSGHAWSLKPTVPWKRPSYGATSPAELEKLAHRLDKLPKYEVQLDAKVPPPMSQQCWRQRGVIWRLQGGVRVR